MLTKDINLKNSLTQCDPNDAQCLLRELRSHQAELAKYKQASMKSGQPVKNMQTGYSEFFDPAPVGYLTLDEMGRTLEINQVGADMLGSETEGMLGKQLIAWIAENDRPMFLKHLRQAFMSRNNPVINIKIETTHGVMREVRLECRVMESVDAGKVLSCHMLMPDQSKHSKVEEAANLTSSVLEGALEGIMITDSHKIIRSVNPAFEKITGYSANEAVGGTPALLKSNYHDTNFFLDMWEAVDKNGQWQGEIWNRQKNGEIYPVWMNISAVRDSRQRIIHYVGVFSDFHIQALLLERLQYLAYHDGLTGLPNRTLFLDRLNISISHARRDKHMLAVIFVDLDQFKQINDTLGHKAGDELLVSMAERMKGCLREGDTLARFGGDEFVAILPVINEIGDASHVARKFLESYTKPLTISGQNLKVTASIGISIFPKDGKNADELVRHADIAMYQTKEMGRNNYLLYTAEAENTPVPM